MSGTPRLALSPVAALALSALGLAPGPLQRMTLNQPGLGLGPDAGAAAARPARDQEVIRDLDLLQRLDLLQDLELFEAPSGRDGGAADGG